MRNQFQSHDRQDKEFMTTLAKGLTVLAAFGRQRPAMTLSEALPICRGKTGSIGRCR